MRVFVLAWVPTRVGEGAWLLMERKHTEQVLSCLHVPLIGMMRRSTVVGGKGADGKEAHEAGARMCIYA